MTRRQAPEPRICSHDGCAARLNYGNAWGVCRHHRSDVRNAQYEANREAVIAQSKAYYQEHRQEILERKAATYDAAAQRRKYLAWKYGVTPEWFEHALAAQGNLCAICRLPFMNTKDTHVDHDHRTGEPRRILNSKCNTALGLMDDDPARLRAAADYLESFRQ